MPNSGHPDLIFCGTRICPFITWLLMLQHSIYTVLPLSSAPGRHNPPPFPQSHDVTWHCVHLHHETQPAHRCEQTAGLHTASLGGTVHNTKLCKTGVSKCHLPVLQLLTQSWFSQEHWEGLQTELAVPQPQRPTALGVCFFFAILRVYCNYIPEHLRDNYKSLAGRHQEH